MINMIKRKAGNWGAPLQHHGPSGASCGVAWSIGFGSANIVTLCRRNIMSCGLQLCTFFLRVRRDNQKPKLRCVQARDERLYYILFTYNEKAKLIYKSSES